ncbi:hypothetical protein FKL24_27000, partial [Klebsiella pneumoniae]|nr:hypothetical protein [Klebsiella pneumoniae]
MAVKKIAILNDALVFLSSAEIIAWSASFLSCMVKLPGSSGHLFCNGTVAKLAMRQPFVLFKGLTFQKLCLP